MGYILETKTQNGVTCNVSYDEYTDSPREWDNLSKLALKHSRYNLPNETDINLNDIESLSELVDIVNSMYDIKVLKFVSMYDHSGVSLSIHDIDDIPSGFDNSLIGIAFIENNEEIKEYYADTTDEKLTEYLYNEVKTYSQYLNGEVYRFDVIDDETGEQLDCGGGYYSVEEAMTESDFQYWIDEKYNEKHGISRNQLQIEFS